MGRNPKPETGAKTKTEPFPVVGDITKFLCSSGFLCGGRYASWLEGGGVLITTGLGWLNVFGLKGESQGEETRDEL